MENFSWPLFVASLALCAGGLLNLYSISSAMDFSGDWSWFTRQSLYLLPALAVMGAVLLLDYQYFKKLAWPLYILSFMSLVAVFFAGTKVKGATRWLDLGLFRFQPGETIKVALVVVLAAWLTKRNPAAGLDFKDLLAPALLMAAPIFLIHKQPDLGTALHLAVTCLPMFLVFRFRSRVKWTAAFLAFVLAGFMAFMQFSGSWHMLLEKGLVKPHQANRVLVYLNPEEHRAAGGWQVSQSENAVGSGQITGRGFMEGLQHRNGFLPEAETDFAFAALAEEWGFLGSAVILAVFALLLTHGLAVAQFSKDLFGSLIALGLTSLLFWQVVINVGMVTGLFPVVGIPLPFISYGGTSLVMTFLAVGLILNIGMRRYLFKEQPLRDNPELWNRPEDITAPSRASIRPLGPDTPFNPEVHPRHRLPHVRPWAKYLRKSKALRHWQVPEPF
ncbi:MAG: rod shape-determining protein RodA [Deltaproteobacteria bacterium]|nr:rod shape-determining protein RodA [Deltaproteobacteria bacterium]